MPLDELPLPQAPPKRSLRSVMYSTIAHRNSHDLELEPAWKRAALQCAVQHPLIRTDATLQGLSALRERPKAVTVGIGLASRSALSRGIPFDVLGMLLPAEQVRRAAGAERLVVLIADQHALMNGFAQTCVKQRAREVAKLLETLRAALGLPLDIVHAAVMHEDPSYGRIHDAVRANAGEAHPYVTLEVADTAYLRRKHGSILKVGWALGERAHAASIDERYFDERFRSWVGEGVGFAYCHAGRTLDPRRLKAAPYLVIDPARRLLLTSDEAVESKLSTFGRDAPEHVQRAVKAHLRRITQVYSRAIAPLRGSLAERVRSVLTHIFARPCASASRRAPGEVV